MDQQELSRKLDQHASNVESCFDIVFGSDARIEAARHPTGRGQATLCSMLHQIELMIVLAGHELGTTAVVNDAIFHLGRAVVNARKAAELLIAD